MLLHSSSPCIVRGNRIVYSDANIGSWMRYHWRRRAEQSGVQQAARNMRKAGIPLHISLSILARKD